MHTSKLDLDWKQLDDDSPELMYCDIETNYSKRRLFKQIDMDTPSSRIYVHLNEGNPGGGHTDIYNGHDLPSFLESLVVYYHFLGSFETSPGGGNSDFDKVVFKNTKVTLKSLSDKFQNQGVTTNPLRAFIMGQNSVLYFNWDGE